MPEPVAPRRGSVVFVPSDTRTFDGTDDVTVRASAIATPIQLIQDAQRRRYVANDLVAGEYTMDVVRSTGILRAPLVVQDAKTTIVLEAQMRKPDESDLGPIPPQTPLGLAEDLLLLGAPRELVLLRLWGDL